MIQSRSHTCQDFEPKILQYFEIKSLAGMRYVAHMYTEQQTKQGYTASPSLFYLHELLYSFSGQQS